MEIRRLAPSDAPVYRALMLEGYDRFPRAFTSTVAEREPLSLEWWEERLGGSPGAGQLVFGAFDGSELVGVAGLRLLDRPRTRHKAWLYGMYVRPEAAGRGIGRALVQRVVDEATALPRLQVLQLTVAEDNAAARQLYESCGFRTFGVEPWANRLDEGYVAIVHMWRPVGPEVGEPPSRDSPEERG